MRKVYGPFPFTEIQFKNNVFTRINFKRKQFQRDIFIWKDHLLTTITILV